MESMALILADQAVAGSPARFVCLYRRILQFPPTAFCDRVQITGRYGTNGGLNLSTFSGQDQSIKSAVIPITVSPMINLLHPMHKQAL